MRVIRVLAVGLGALALAGCGGGDSGSDGPLTVYSGREEELVAPLFEKFTDATGIDVEVRYGDSAELAATIAEEGSNSPADVFFAQDRWVGTSGRTRVLVYNTGQLSQDELPASVLQLTEPAWKNRVGIAPTNA